MAIGHATDNTAAFARFYAIHNLSEPSTLTLWQVTCLVHRIMLEAGDQESCVQTCLDNSMVAWAYITRSTDGLRQCHRLSA